MPTIANYSGILLISDDQIMIESYQKSFKEAGFDFYNAPVGQAGIFSVKENKPVIILLDLMSTPLDGLSILRQIKTDGGIKEIPVIVLANLGEEVHLKKCFELGAIEYLIKANHTSTQIVQKVKNIIVNQTYY